MLDARYAIRVLPKSCAFTLVALFTLMLGIAESAIPARRALGDQSKLMREE